MNDDERSPKARYSLWVEAHLNGQSFSEIGRQHGVSREWVRRVVRRAGVPAEQSAQIRAAPRVVLPCAWCGEDVVRRAKAVSPQNTVACSRACAARANAQKYKRTPQDKADMLEGLRRLAKRLGRTPSQYEINKDKTIPCHVTYVNAFGSVRNAQIAAGLKANTHGGAR